VRSYYATPIDLGFRPWALDFTPDDAGTSAFPHDCILNPYAFDPPLKWRTDDWDPALRFWTLPFDPTLTEWLKAVDTSRPSIMAAREFAAEHAKWIDPAAWLEEDDLKWSDAADTAGAWSFIQGELSQLQMLMQDDRDRYLAEIDVQADGLADYVRSFVGISQARHPWTVELISSGLAIGNIAYMSYKAKYKRVRPSALCPGLIPAFGPPMHPAFPSGHSLLGHLLALMLLEIPPIAARFGVFDPARIGDPGTRPTAPMLKTRAEISSPLLWLAQRLAKNRERLGVHYPSDSYASRHIAAGIWQRLWPDPPATAGDPQPVTIDCPTLMAVWRKAAAEWS
jgi:membrane-associated phospholipid phosphatase